MAIYKVVTPPVEGVVHVLHTPSMSSAKAARRGFMEGFGLKLNDITIEEAPVNRGKTGTIDYLNAFHAQLPATYVPAGHKPKATAAKKKARKKASPKK